ncbi:pyridine nucleotide-disulfide oxidoreductase [Sporanaerobium hydrogeniformans]|uniref:Pyridine nucleotide-disulfide oxidoreductase n=1 Tax=Sporanaerobium hydrogeniformans TaxID=3072179 RepID=A0AC61D794_9FIRM|nr:FAD-dependent oxidoreductase [Sporanaerobium hydrogeniformans]PHV69414.1 pyridine nucleotide-disulfide oxidoreductase [Sporanaerobium hydrogeniformans]
MKIIIIGSVIAGNSVIHKLVDTESDVQITAYEKGRFMACGTYGLPYYLGKKESSIGEIIAHKREELEKENIQINYCHEVIGLDVAVKRVTIKNLRTNESFIDTYDKLIIATGSTSLIPHVPGADKMGVHVLNSVEDLIFLKEFTKTPYVSDIAILGGDFAGLEIAKAFLKLGRNVRLIEESTRLLPSFDTEVASHIMKELKAQGMEVILGARVTGFTGGTFVENVQTDKGTYPCDLVIPTNITRPNTFLLQHTPIAHDEQGAIIIDKELKTSISDIYAIGGCTAPIENPEETLSLHIAQMEMARTGMSEEQAIQKGLAIQTVMKVANDRPSICPNPNQIAIKLIYEAQTHKILGAQAWGKKNVCARINALAVAIAAGMTTEALAQVNFIYSSSTNTMWDPIQVACHAVR